MPPCRAWLLTYHPLAACGAKTRVRERIVAAGSALQRCHFCASHAPWPVLVPTVGRTAFELCVESKADPWRKQQLRIEKGSDPGGVGHGSARNVLRFASARVSCAACRVHPGAVDSSTPTRTHRMGDLFWIRLRTSRVWINPPLLDTNCFFIEFSSTYDECQRTGGILTSYLHLRLST